MPLGQAPKSSVSHLLTSLLRKRPKNAVSSDLQRMADASEITDSYKQSAVVADNSSSALSSPLPLRISSDAHQIGHP